MIAHLRGKLLSKHPNQAIVETAGVGYDVVITVPTFSDLPALGNEVALHIHTHVREDTIALYGFFRPAEKQLFEKLLTVSGIGPKLAITILSGMAADEMVGAIRGGDVARLTRIRGSAKRPRSEWCSSCGTSCLPWVPRPWSLYPTLSAVEEDVVSALVNLGYQRAAAEKSLQSALKTAKPPATFEVLFREALGALSK